MRTSGYRYSKITLWTFYRPAPVAYPGSMSSRMIIASAFFSITLSGTLGAMTLFTLSATYTPYNVTISFDTSLAGTSLENLVSDDITSTASNFAETNNIVANGSASLQVIISTDPFGNITAFTITDAVDQVVTNTSDTGAEGNIFIAPPSDQHGIPLSSESIAGGQIIASYNTGTCTYNDTSGTLVTDSDGGSCPSTASSEPLLIVASGQGTFTSTPPNPGTVPEPSSAAAVGAGLAGLLMLAKYF